MDLKRAKPLHRRDRARVRRQAPLALSDAPEPEADLALVRPDDDSDEHPTAAVLVIEVAQTSARTARLYAAAGPAEYWLVDLTAEVVEVCRTPKRGRYTILERLRAGTVAPPALPDVAVDVAALLRWLGPARP